MKRTTFIPLLLLVCSCSPIWEDRSDSPSWFSLNFQEVDPNIEQLHIWFIDNDIGEVIYRDTVSSAEYKAHHEIMLPRINNLKYYVFGNITSATELIEDKTLNTALKKKDKVSADSLYYCSSKLINTCCEFVYDTVRLHKEFANIDFILQSTPQKGDDIYINVHTSTAGLYIDRRFIPSDASTYVEDRETIEGNSLFRFRMLRQEYIEDLYIEICGTVAGIPVKIENFPLGEFLKKSNYDMSSDDLKDVTITMDMSFNFINIKIEDWTSTYPVDIEI